MSQNDDSEGKVFKAAAVAVAHPLHLVSCERSCQFLAAAIVRPNPIIIQPPPRSEIGKNL